MAERIPPQEKKRERSPTVVNDGKGLNQDEDSANEKHQGKHRRQQQQQKHNTHRSDSTAASAVDDGCILWWHSPVPHVPLKTEEDMLKVILKWGRTERGMVKDQPLFRRHAIQKRCKKNRLPIALACSLRRHHMSLLNPYLSKEALGLGGTQDIRDAAEIFEQVIAAYLRRNKVQYWDEQEQKQHFKQTNPGLLLQATPDFMMKEPLLLKKYSVNKKTEKRHVFEERTVHWIEAKMFYGASTVPLHDERSAVGSILPKMKKYVSLYGEGAIVFMQGCGQLLASELAKVGVMALCCSSKDFDLSQVHDHQKTWCADKQGTILP